MMGEKGGERIKKKKKKPQGGIQPSNNSENRYFHEAIYFIKQTNKALSFQFYLLSSSEFNLLLKTVYKPQ